MCRRCHLKEVPREATRETWGWNDKVQEVIKAKKEAKQILETTWCGFAGPGYDHRKIAGVF